MNYGEARAQTPEFTTNNEARAKLPDLHKRKKYASHHKHEASRVRANARSYVQDMANHASSHKALPALPRDRSNSPTHTNHKSPEASPTSHGATQQMQTSPLSVFTRSPTNRTQPQPNFQHPGASSPGTQLMIRESSKTSLHGKQGGGTLAHSASAPVFGGNRNRQEHTADSSINQPLRLMLQSRDSFTEMPRRVPVPREGVPKASSLKAQRLIKDWTVRAESCRRSGRQAAEIVACWSMGILHDNCAQYVKAVGCYINAAVILQRSLKELEVKANQEATQGAPMMLEDGERAFEQEWAAIRGDDRIMDAPPQDEKKRTERLRQEADMMTRCPVSLPIVYNAIGISLHAAGPKYVEKAGKFHHLHLEHSDPRDLAGKFVAFSNLGITYMALGSAEEASQFHLSAVQVASRLRDPMRQRVAIGNLGMCRHAQGDYTLATECLEVQMARGTSARSQLKASKTLASIASERGDQERATGYYDRAYSLAKQSGDEAASRSAATQMGISIGKAKLEEHMRAAAQYFNAESAVS